MFIVQHSGISFRLCSNICKQLIDLVLLFLSHGRCHEMLFNFFYSKLIKSCTTNYTFFIGRFTFLTRCSVNCRYCIVIIILYVRCSNICALCPVSLGKSAGNQPWGETPKFFLWVLVRYFLQRGIHSVTEKNRYGSGSGFGWAPMLL
jgi:hypothetical protein